jgi:plastocyanin
MRFVTAAILAAAIVLPASAATVSVRVQDARGAVVEDAVVYAVPEGRQLPLARKTAVMDQKNRTFIPHVLAVQTGTSVRFPNSDDVRHHVYSFSPAKSFQLPLYKGTTAKPVLFHRAGLVTVGCNIHDQMSAYIVVVETPYFEKTGADGRATLEAVSSGRYSVRVWYPSMREEPRPETITVTGDERVQVTFVAGRAAAAGPGGAAIHAHARP